MFCLLVVLAKLSVLAKWLARKTPLRKPNRGEGIISIKLTPKNVHDFLGLLYCFIVLLCICVVSCPYVIYCPTVMARYSLFVLKVPLNPKQTNKQSRLGWGQWEPPTLSTGAWLSLPVTFVDVWFRVTTAGVYGGNPATYRAAGMTQPVRPVQPVSSATNISYQWRELMDQVTQQQHRKWYFLSTGAPCRFPGCKNRSAPFPGQMS